MLINVGTEPVVIEDERRGAGVVADAAAPRGRLPRVRARRHARAGHADVERRDREAHHDRARRSATRSRVKLDTLEQNPAGTMLRHYDIGGSVFLAELKAGKETIYGQLQIKPRRVRVFPRNYEHLADQPLVAAAGRDPAPEPGPHSARGRARPRGAEAGGARGPARRAPRAGARRGPTSRRSARAASRCRVAHRRGPQARPAGVAAPPGRAAPMNEDWRKRSGARGARRGAEEAAPARAP